MIVKWMSLSALALGLATGGAVRAADQASAETDEASAATQPRVTRPGIEEVVAKAKRPAPMEPVSVGAVHVEIKAEVSAGRIEIATPELRLAREDAPRAPSGDADEPEQAASAEE